MFIVVVKVERVRRKSSITRKQSTTAAQNFSLKISNRFAENAMSLTTIEGRAQSNNNGPSI